MAYLTGFFCLGVGETFRRKEVFRNFGLALMGAGLAILYFSSFAAFQIYSLVSQPVAFGLFVLVTLSAGFLAYVHNSRWLAVIGLVGGFITPFILKTDVVNQIYLMTYIAVLNLAVLGLARMRDWRFLTTLGFVFTWLVFSSWFFVHYSKVHFWPTILFLNLFYLIHFLSPVVCSTQRKAENSSIDLITALLNTVFAFAFSYSIIGRYASTEHVAFVTLPYAMLSAGMAVWEYRRHLEDTRSFTLQMFMGGFFFIITVPIVFSENWITVFWAAQAAILMWIAARLDNKGINYGFGVSILLLLAALGKLYFFDYKSIFGLGQSIPGAFYHSGFAAMLAERWVTLAITLASLAATAVCLPDSRQEYRPFLLGLFAILLFYSLTVETSAFFLEAAPKAHSAALSVLWGLYALTLLLIGFLRNSLLLRKASLGLFGLTVLKVFTVDIVNLYTPFRIISFMGLGVLLIGASFLYYSKKDQLTSGGKDEQPVSME